MVYGQFVPRAHHVSLNLQTPLTSLQILSWLVEYCFTSTETVGLLGTGTRDGHLDFHTVPEL